MAEKIRFLGRSRFLDKKERNHIRQSLTTLCIKNNHTIESLVYVHQSDEEILKLNHDLQVFWDIYGRSRNRFINDYYDAILGLIRWKISGK